MAEAFAINTITTNIEGIVPRNIINISKELAHRLICKLTVPVNKKLKFQEILKLSQKKI